MAKTCAASDEVMVDLDEMDMVLGVEVLSIAAEIPFTELHERFHVHSETIDALRAIQPTVQSFLLTHAPDGVSSASDKLVPSAV